MKISLINHDSTGSVKVDIYATEGDMKQPESTRMLMANVGTEPMELELGNGKAFLLTAQPDMTLESNGKIINPDSQQNIVTSERIDTSTKEVIPAPVQATDSTLRDITEPAPKYVVDTSAEVPKMRIPSPEELNDKTVVNPDSQQNMTVKERQDVPPVAQQGNGPSTVVPADQPTPGPVDDPTIVHLPAVDPDPTLANAQATTDAVAEAQRKAIEAAQNKGVTK